MIITIHKLYITVGFSLSCGRYLPDYIEHGFSALTEKGMNTKLCVYPVPQTSRSCEGVGAAVELGSQYMPE